MTAIAITVPGNVIPWSVKTDGRGHIIPADRVQRGRRAPSVRDGARRAAIEAAADAAGLTVSDWLRQVAERAALRAARRRA